MKLITSSLLLTMLLMASVSLVAPSTSPGPLSFDFKDKPKNKGGGNNEGGAGGYFGPGGGFNIPGFGKEFGNGIIKGGGGYGVGYGGPNGGYSKGGVIRPTVVCKEKGPCYGKKLTCPVKCFTSYSRSGKGYGTGGGGGGCTTDCKKKCIAYC